MSRSKKRILLYAKILTIYSVTEIVDSTFFQKLVNYWQKTSQGIRCKFSVHLQELSWKLDMLNKIMNNTNRRESFECFMDIIISDVFQNLTKQFQMQLCSEEIDFQIPFIQQKLEVQAPQYLNLIVFQEE